MEQAPDLTALRISLSETRLQTQTIITLTYCLITRRIMQTIGQMRMIVNCT